jgi:hypothetical protein
VASVAVTVMMAVTAAITVVAGVEAPAVFNNSERYHNLYTIFAMFRVLYLF